MLSPFPGLWPTRIKIGGGSFSQISLQSYATLLEFFYIPVGFDNVVNLNEGFLLEKKINYPRKVFKG